jgi:putative addiction module component (TIGR02574 family)
MTLEQLEAAALNLPIQERIRLAQELWDSILSEAEAEPDLLPLTEEQIREIERRLAEHERDPSSAIPWEEAHARLRSRLG